MWQNHAALKVSGIWDVKSQNGWVGKNSKDNLSPTSLPWAGTYSTRPGWICNTSWISNSSWFIFKLKTELKGKKNPKMPKLTLFFLSLHENI